MLHNKKKGFDDAVSVLYAEDMDGMAVLLEKRLLELFPKASIKRVKSADEFLDAVKKKTYDFCVLDDLMPPTGPTRNGSDALIKLRAYEKENNLERAIVFSFSTTHKDESGEEKFKGADGAIEKPLKPDGLIKNEIFMKKISGLLENRHADEYLSPRNEWDSDEYFSPRGAWSEDEANVKEKEKKAGHHGLYSPRAGVAPETEQADNSASPNFNAKNNRKT